jgi:ornithine cyclodeaminase/alanine dehydrogenase-like protein (mu-crystallin family)
VESGATTIFKSLGMAVEDVATAKLVYEASRNGGLQTADQKNGDL